MELIERNIQLPRRAIKREPTIEIGIADITAMEEELNKLQVLFSAASFILAEHKFRTLSHLCRRHAQLKLEVANYFQRLKFYSIENRKIVLKSRLRLNASLINEILSLRSRIQEFHSKLFRDRTGKRQML
jgi:hypothetical protein